MKVELLIFRQIGFITVYVEIQTFKYKLLKKGSGLQELKMKGFKRVSEFLAHGRQLLKGVLT